MQDSSLDDTQSNMPLPKIEIIVGSVLMHAWAEIEHDLIYKPENGNVSNNQEAILDERDGWSSPGVALERLQRALQRRLTEKDAPFDSHYDLAAYLHRWLQGAEPKTNAQMGRVDLLWELLREGSAHSATSQEEVGEPEFLSMPNQFRSASRHYT